MKKSVFTLLVSLFILGAVLLTGCNKDNVLTLKVVSALGSVKEIDADIEYDKWPSPSFRDESRPQNLQVEILGTTFDGTYCDSEIPDRAFSPYHKYNTQGALSEFKVDSEGNLVECYWDGRPPVDPADLSESELIDRAYRLVVQITNSDLDDYTPGITFYENMQSYTVTFTKYLNGIPTADQAKVVLYRDGTPVMFETILFGKIPANADKTFDLNKVNQNVVNRCDELTKAARKSYDAVEYSDWSHVLTMDEKGHYYILVSVTIACKQVQGEGELRSSIRLEFIQSM